MKWRYRGQEVELGGTPVFRWLKNDLLEITVGDRVLGIPVARLGDSMWIGWQGTGYEFVAAQLQRATAHHHAGDGLVVAPMPCVIVQVLVSEGQPVTSGQPLLVIEAMKTVQTLLSPFAGTVTKVYKEEKGLVSEGDPLVHVVE